MRRVLIAGGAGHIGSHLCELHLARGDDVTCLDDFSTGARENLAPFASRVRVVEHDVTEPIDAALHADCIYNLACPAAPVHYQRDPVRTLRTSVLGSLHLLEVARRCGARILLASTSEVYGDPEVHPQPEEYAGRVNPTGPRACYDEGKRAAETLFADYRRQYGVDAGIARIFNTYGPRMRRDDGRVVPAFILRALAGDPIELHGDGSQTRSFCFVTDMAEGLRRLLDAGDPGPVNLGNHPEISIRTLAETVLELTSSTSPLRPAPRPEEDPARRCPDLARARALLDWSPQVGLHEGLAKTVAWFAGR